MMSVAVNIVTWNGKEFLPFLLQSLLGQTVQPKRILVIDNGSIDGTVELLREWPTIHVLRNNRNLGFAHAHNQGISLSDADAVLIVNQDLILDPKCIENLVAGLERDPKLGSVCPVTYRFSFSNDEVRTPVLSDTVDSAGLSIRRSRQAVNRGEGSKNTDFPAETFGAPGVLALYRKTALDDVTWNHEYFDDDFFAYKEDVDLAWRLRWAGWSCNYVPSARAYHYRSVSHHNDSFVKVLRERPTRTPLYRTLSYRNHLLTMVKNETIASALPHLHYIIWYELRRIAYLALREWQTLVGLPQALRLMPQMSKKRKIFAPRRRISPALIRSLLSR